MKRRCPDGDLQIGHDGMHAFSRAISDSGPGACSVFDGEIPRPSPAEREQHQAQGEIKLLITLIFIKNIPSISVVSCRPALQMGKSDCTTWPGVEPGTPADIYDILPPKRGVGVIHSPPGLIPHIQSLDISIPPIQNPAERTKKKTDKKKGTRMNYDVARIRTGDTHCIHKFTYISKVGMSHSPPGLTPSFHKLYLYPTLGVYITK
jgi:hypothetical protein